MNELREVFESVGVDHHSISVLLERAAGLPTESAVRTLARLVHGMLQEVVEARRQHAKDAGVIAELTRQLDLARGDIAVIAEALARATREEACR